MAAADQHGLPEQPQAGLEVQLCDTGERGEQAALFRANFGAEDALAVLNWRYDRCPHGQPVTLIGKVGGQAVAGYACNPRRIGWQDGDVTIGQTGDVMTLAEARGKGFFSELDRRAMEATAQAGWPVVFGLPNRQSAPLFLGKLGWSGVGRLKPWTLVCKVDAVARAERMRAGRLASLWTGSAYRQGRRKLAALKERGRDFHAVPIERFDDWVEAPVKQVAKSYPWMVRRDAAYLNWRFFDSPNARFTAWRLDGPDGQAAGYVVVQAPFDGRGVGYLVDLVAPDPRAHGAGIACAVAGLHQLGASVVRAHAIADSDWQGQLMDAGFQPPKAQDEKWVIVLVHQSEHPLAQIAMDASRWFFTDADRDDELVR